MSGFLHQQPMQEQKSRICIALPYPPTYSETFLKAHVEQLHATVRYLEHFPVVLDDSYFKHVAPNTNEMRLQQFKGIVHRFLNPAKRVSLRRFFKRNHVGVVLAEYGGTGAHIFRFCQETHIPLVVHFHGADAYHRENLDRYKKHYKKMFGYSSAIVAVSKHMVKQLIGLGAPSEKIVYIPCGTEVSRFTGACHRHAPMHVLAAGRFVEKKAPYLTILAFRRVLDRLPAAKLIMVGTGELHDVCRQLVRSLHMEHTVDFKGQVSHEEVASLMRQSRVFVQHSLVPSSGDSEGTPVTVIEASASALPVVSTRHAGIVDTVIHGETGFLVDEGDIDGMADYISQLLSNPELAVEMGSRARTYACQNFDIEGSIQKLKDILDRCAR